MMKLLCLEEENLERKDFEDIMNLSININTVAMFAITIVYIGPVKQRTKIRVKLRFFSYPSV